MVAWEPPIGGLPVSRQLDLGKQQLWLGRIQRWQRSQRSVRDFCTRHRLSEPSFYSWRRLLTERGLLPPAGAAAAQPNADSGPTATPLFVAATLADSDAAPQPLEILLPDGLAVRVAAGFDAATLREVLALLREQPC
jgi:transposase-like protein